MTQSTEEIAQDYILTLYSDGDCWSLVKMLLSPNPRGALIAYLRELLADSAEWAPHEIYRCEQTIAHLESLP